MAKAARSFDFLLCDHAKTFTLDDHIPNITLYTSVVARVTYGSRKWAELVEVDWIGRLKRRIPDIKKLTDEVNWNSYIPSITKEAPQQEKIILLQRTNLLH